MHSEKDVENHYKRLFPIYYTPQRGNYYGIITKEKENTLLEYRRFIPPAERFKIKERTMWFFLELKGPTVPFTPHGI